MAMERRGADTDRARLLAREQALAEIAGALVRERELSKVIDVVLAQSQGVLGADVVGVWLAEPLRREMTMLAFRGKTPTVLDLLHTLSFDAPSLIARAALTEEPQVVSNIPSQHTALPLFQKVAAMEGMRSALSLPLHSGGHLIGVITFAWSEPREFSNVDLAFDATLADLFAVAIENAHVYDLLSQALRAREEFMATAAHELRTPLTVIKGSTQRLLRNEAQSPRSRNALEAVDKHVDRITRIVNDLLQSVEVRPGLATLNLERIDLSALAEEAASTLKKVGGEQTIRVSTEGHFDVNVDPILIVEAVKRLVENALRYTPSNREVEVAVCRRGNEAIVSVTDHGVGVVPDRQAHVFEPFYDLVPPGTPGYVGMSDLGLYLSKHIIEAHGGRIWHGITPGGGSTFTFSLPLVSSTTGD